MCCSHFVIVVITAYIACSYEFSIFLGNIIKKHNKENSKDIFHLNKYVFIYSEDTDFDN